MSTEFDTTKIRRLAAQLGRTAASVDQVRQTSLQRAKQEMPSNFKGQAADALDTSIMELMGDVRRLSSQISGISSALYALARRVDEADAKAAKLIHSN